jgi:hypothetical protein
MNQSRVAHKLADPARSEATAGWAPIQPEHQAKDLQPQPRLIGKKVLHESQDEPFLDEST